MPRNHDLKFFVYMVESPSPIDIYHGRKETELLDAATKLNGIPFFYKTAINETAFRAALILGIQEALDTIKDRLPILHLSAHGDGDGIQLSSGERILWTELKNLLMPINKAINGNLLLCMSSCEGYSGIRMAMDADAVEFPYYAIIGCGSKPTWAEAAIAYATLYHHVSQGEYIFEAVKKMRVASGKEDFYVKVATEAQQSFIEYLKLKPVSEDGIKIQEIESTDQQSQELKEFRDFKET